MLIIKTCGRCKILNKIGDYVMCCSIFAHLTCARRKPLHEYNMHVRVICVKFFCFNPFMNITLGLYVQTEKFIGLGPAHTPIMSLKQ